MHNLSLSVFATLQKIENQMNLTPLILIILLLSQVMLSTYLPSLVGVIVAYLLMMAANIYKPVKKGPM